MYIHKLLKNIPQKHLQYFPRYFTHFFLNSSSFFWLWIWYLTTIANISGIRLQSNRGFVDTGRTSKFSHLLCTTFEVPIVREQGWAIWRGKHPNLRNKRDKTLKNLLVCTILTFSTKNWGICCRAGGVYRWKIPTLSLWLVQHWVISDNSGLSYHSFWKIALFLETTLKWTDFFLIHFHYFFYFIWNKTCWILILASMFCLGMTPSSIFTSLFQKRKLEFAIFLFA